MITTNSMSKELLEEVPELVPVYQEHMSDYDELLPHILMGDISRFVGGLAEEVMEGSRNRERELSKILDYLERALVSGDEDMKNVVVVSFLENLEQDSPYYEFLKKSLGKELRSNLIAIEET